MHCETKVTLLDLYLAILLDLSESQTGNILIEILQFNDDDDYYH